MLTIVIKNNSRLYSDVCFCIDCNNIRLHVENQPDFNFILQPIDMIGIAEKIKAIVQLT